MQLGIDFGTTRTVIASVNRGNYPIVSFHTEEGDTLEWYPSMVASNGAEIKYGFDAADMQGAGGWQVLRSFKNRLAAVGPNDAIAIGSHTIAAIDLLTNFLSSLRQDLQTRSNLRLKKNETLETMISLPANANSNQRFLTLEAFRRAGFEVRGMMNEPSAAGIEYAHLISSSGGTSTREFLVVYDLGGGTFDSSVISLLERDHEVLSSEGIARLGGDNFDIILLDLALREANIDRVSDAALVTLLEECRVKKEALHPNTRRVTIDLGLAIQGAGEVTLPVNDFYEACRPMIEITIECMEQVMAKSAADAGYNLRDSAAVYLVGGSSDLPLVSRLLREKYGRQVRRSPYPHAATAIGLAIAADTEQGYTLRERFTRYFGTWREAEAGAQVIFDPLFEKDTRLPARGEAPLRRIRQYSPAHNIGRIRYLECSRVDEAGQPQGDVAPWDEIVFPFDPSLQSSTLHSSNGLNALASADITRVGGYGNVIQETYSCDSNGIIEVEIADLSSQYARKFRLRAHEGARSR